MGDETARIDRPTGTTPLGAADTSAPGKLNALIEARLTGRISRRELVRRAGALGLGTALTGVLLHATSDAAFGAQATPEATPDETDEADDPPPRARTVPIREVIKPPGEARQGGTLVIGSTEEPDTLNPYLTQTTAGVDILSGVMEGLLFYDSEQQLRPALAWSFAISDDGLTYTFTLRSDVVFHNGDRFTADDVIATWRMIMNPEAGAISQLGWELIDAIDAPEPDTVVMRTRTVYAPFLSYVAGGTPIAPATALADGPGAFTAGFGRNPIGTGPLAFVDWSPGERIVLERNADYWGKTPRLERVIYRIAADEETHLNRMRDGEVQVLAGAGSLRAPRVEAALALPDVTVSEHLSQTWMHLDLKHVDFLRENPVRRALDFATPTERIIDEVLDGRAVRALGDQAPGTWAFNRSVRARPYDPEKAAQLLDEVGLALDADGRRARGGKPFEVELWGIAGDRTAERVLPLIADSWSALGVATATRFGDAGTIWGTQGYQFTDRMTACFYGWSNENDPDDLYYWHSRSIPSSPGATNGGNLPAFFFDFNFQDKIDDLTTRAVATLNEDERKELYDQIQGLLYAEVPVIFLYWELHFPVIADNVGGLWPSAFNGVLWNVQNWYLTEG